MNNKHRFVPQVVKWALGLSFVWVVVIYVSVASAVASAIEQDADPQAKPEPAIDFAKQVLPILSDKCFVCHGPDSEAVSELRLDSFDSATRDLGDYKAIDPAQPGKSRLLVRIHSQDDPMPPEDAERGLSDAEREILSLWVNQGGRYAKHWAYVPPVSTLPKSNPQAMGSQVIDGFIADQMLAQGVTFSPHADRSTLARRAALILTGLPPEPEVLQSFLVDDSVDAVAYGHLVDQLLADPKFGEHQARYWLDAVRYGDTHGLHLDNRRGIYPYRDWVVKAFNEGLPLDQFITWQLAGDMLPNPTLSQQVASGFVRLNPSTSEGGAIPAEFQAKNNFDRTENFGTVFLGMSLTCARCHTHKYDPIPHQEYYRLLAFFNSTSEGAMDGNQYQYAPVIKAPADQQQWQAWGELESAQLQWSAQAEDILAISKPSPAEAASEVPGTSKSYSELPGTASPELLDFEKQWSTASVQQRLDLWVKRSSEGLSPGTEDLVQAAKALQAQATELQSQWTTTLVAAELEQPRVTKVLERGEYDLPLGEPLERDVISVAGEFPEGAPRNRLGLAQWLVSPKQPLTSRVLVNRIWQRTFGEGLVRTPEEFGLQGEQSTHPELLDWLAVELQRSGWNLKHMLKLMVTSRTFTQSSARRGDVEDPENRLFARGPSFRLDAEVLRDIALWGSGLMVDEMGGEGVKPYQPDGLWLALAHPGSNTKQYVPDNGNKLYRRSLYVYWKRTSPHPMMTLFDAPSREASCVRRSRTNTALQSLALLNETQRIEFARALAENLVVTESEESVRLVTLFKRLASRDPSAKETVICLGLLEQMKQRYAEAEPDALALLATGQATRNAELDPAEVAAWTQVVVTVLASDAVLLLY